MHVCQEEELCPTSVAETQTKMSGKQKQAHRTKGNVRPSSSARAAEQLANTGTSAQGFVGFGVLSDLGYVPASGTSDEADSSVDADFRLVLRKLSKKDSTTKIKALQELAVLCKGKELESVKSVLPFWPRLFSKLSTDNDRRVREACHQTFEQLVLRVRKNLAPHLKSLMGPWIVGQSDVYAPAASAAKSAFQAAFPPAKQSEAVIFCKEEVIHYISENLLTLTPATLSDSKTAEEDVEARYHKVVASSLQGWKTLLTTLSNDQQEALHEKYKNILSNAKFWKLAKHQNSMVKGSFYLVLAALCQHDSTLANQYSEKICPLVLHHLDDTDPAVCPALWEAVLYTVTTMEDCWSKVNPRKGVLPRLWSLLKSGGNGSAHIIYPNLLPFLSKIPTDVTRDGLGFYKEWFDNMLVGLSVDKVQTSKQELSALIHSTVECMKFALTGLDAKQGTDERLSQFILNDKLLVLLEASFVDKASHLGTSPLYSLVGNLLLFLYKHERQDLRDAGSQCWRTLKECIQDHIGDAGDEDMSEKLERIGTFLEAFVKPAAVTEKKRVKFEEKEPPSRDFVSANATKSSALLETGSPLMSLVNDVGLECLWRAQNIDRPSSGHLVLLSTLCNTYGSVELARHLFCGFTETVAEDDCAHMNMNFTEVILLPWLKRTEKYDDQRKRELFVSRLGDVLLMLYKLGTSSEKIELLDLLSQNGNEQLLVSVCERVLAFETDPTVHRWWSGPQFGEAVVRNTRKLCTWYMTDSDVPETQLKFRWELLTLALTAQVNAEPIVGKEFITKILHSIQSALPPPDKRTCMPQNELDKCVSFVSDVAVLLYREMKEIIVESGAEELLLSLFQICCQEKSPVSDTVLHKVDESWKLGVTALLHLKGGFMNDGGFFVKVAEHLKSLVRSARVSCSRVNQLSEKSVELARHIGVVLHEEKTTVLSHPTVSYFIHLLCSDMVDPPVGSEWLTSRLVCGDLTFDCLPKATEPKTDTDSRGDVAPVLFSSNMLVVVLEEGRNLQEEDDAVVVNVALGIALCESLMGRKKQSMAGSEVGTMCERLERNLRVLMSSIQPSRQTEFLQIVIDRSFSEGGLWSLCLQVVLREAAANKWNVIVGSLLGMVDRLSCLVEPVLHTLQVAAPHMTKTELGTVVQILTAQLLTCDQDAVNRITGGRGFVAGVVAAAAQQESPVGEGGGGGVHLEPQVVLSVLTQLQLWREQHEDLFLFETDLNVASWELVSLNIEIMKLLKLLVEKLPSVLSEHQWDFLLCSLVSWVQTCHESRSLLDTSLAHQSFLLHTCDLLTSTAACMAHVLPERREAFPSNLAAEWREFFSQGAYSLLLPIFVQLTEFATPRTDLSVEQDAVLRYLCTAVCDCPLEHLKNHQLPAKLVADHDTAAPDELQTLLNHLCPRLITGNRATQIAAFRLLQRLVPEFPAFDSEREKSLEAEQESRSPPPALMTVLDTCRAAVDLIMGDVPVGEPVVVETDTEEDMYTRGYLFCWDLLLTFFKSAPSEMRAKYASFLRDNGAVDHLLANLFRLMPENPVIQLHESLTSASPSQKLSSVMSMFSRSPSLQAAGNNSSSELAHLACAVYHRALQDLPAIVRQWWNAQDKRVAAVVEKFTSKHVTQVLCSEEMDAISKSDVAMEDMTVKTRPAAREVAATYTIQEFTMELIVQLPVNHPLGVVSVDSGKRVGVPTNLWRNWMLQMTTFLTHQNGSMLDGLALWKRNVDKKFAGVEECMVCFSVIHPSNYQLPKLQCKVCKKKFHSACLYKWFSTSNNSTCPMCRSLF